MDSRKKLSGIFAPRASFYLWIILILVTVIGVLEWRVAIPGSLLLAFLVYHNFRSAYKRHKEITKYIENLTLNIDVATKDTLLNFPLPLVVVELDGTIIWYNSSFRKLFEGMDLLERTLDSFIEELNPDSIINNITDISRQVLIGDKYYQVLGSFARVEGMQSTSNYILSLYFVDNTELVNVRTRYQEEKIAVAAIVIDNYDDLMQGLEDTSRPQILAEIEKKLTAWIGFTGGILKKHERDKYLLIFEIKYLKELEDKKFDILDSIKEINIGNKIPVTLSIGVGINGSTLIEKLQFAAASIDIALGRGGDQVVIKNGSSFSFYGGKTRELEKRTRVKARVIAYALRELIDQSPQVLIMGHENADIDCIGAALGIYRIVRGRNKEAHIVLSRTNATIDNLVNKVQKTEEYEGVFIGRGEALDRINTKTLLVVVDTHRPGFTEQPELLERSSQVVVIDHHRKGTDFIQDAVLTYQETYASSTCELVTEILQYADEKLKLEAIEAEALYAGIVVDTKNFTFKTGVRTFEAASYLRKQGVDTVAVKQLFQNDLATYSNVSNTVKSAEIIHENIAISACAPNIKNAQLITAKAADELLNLTGIMAAFVMCEVGNEIMISGRSLGDINVQVILEKLGGGGHLTVAGAQLEGESIEDAKEKLKCAIMEYVNEINRSERQ